MAQNSVDLVIIGAGLSGLVAASELSGDIDLVVVDKARSPGGRLATRRIGDATFDHGAQFFTVRSQEFANEVTKWSNRSISKVWTYGFQGESDGHPRYIGVHGMNSIAKDLATGIRMDLQNAVSSITYEDSKFHIHGHPHDYFAKQLVIAIPCPSAIEITKDLPSSSVTIIRDSLGFIAYNPTISGLFVMMDDGDFGPIQPIQRPNSKVNFLADNKQKGISAKNALTLHLGDEISLELFYGNYSQGEIESILRENLFELIGEVPISEMQVKSWRYASPISIYPEAVMDLGRIGGSGALPLIFSGDGYGSSKVEGAYLSGLRAAAAVREYLG
ncbi:FAD-dependent oxidoreductase [Acidithrix sp. C25]|uniref:NAD(P)/FAD-dependent oxidoreductase n=1 Tax=Acidithrix sp. C25 TaxID=1671482 RepID=UPI001BCD3FC0|nr:FAD-dependent oxidoreductase [Acidithrix sp. C25]